MKKDTVKPIEAFKPKMRVSLLEKNLVKIADRLVSMDIELASGPKEKHNGPISLELTLRDKEDVESFKAYLGRLVGDLPLPEKKVYKSGKKAISLLDEEPLKELLKDMEKKCKTLDEMVKYLRDKGFVFVTREFIADMEIPANIKDVHNDCQFLIRKIKEAKNPVNDKYDPQLIIGVKFAPKKKPSARVYLYNEYEKTIALEWQEKSDINFKKIKLTKFPPYMIKEERERYRLEERKYQLNPELERSKFWNRWVNAVEDFNKQ